MVSVTFWIGTPSFCALMRSISTNTCGVLAVKGENTEVRPGALRAAATSSSVAAAKASEPRPLRAPTPLWSVAAPKGCGPAPAAILDAHREAAAGTDAGHRGRRNDD